MKLLSEVNIVDVKEPRWHDRVILPKCSKFVQGDNIITINYHSFPNPFYMHSYTASQYPKEIKHGRSGDYDVYVIPLADLTTVAERNTIVKTARELFKPKQEQGVLI